MTTVPTMKRLVTSMALLAGLFGAVVGRVEALDWPVKNLRVGAITYQTYCETNPFVGCPHPYPEFAYRATFSVSFSVPDPYGLRADGSEDRTNNGAGRPFHWFSHQYELRTSTGHTVRSRTGATETTAPWRTIRDRDPTSEITYWVNFDNEDSPDQVFTFTVITVPYYYRHNQSPDNSDNSVTQSITVRVPNKNNPTPPDPEPETPTEPQNTYSLPLVLAADNAGLTGFVRIINRSAQAGNVQIHAIDDNGRRFDPVNLSIDDGASVNFNSRDLERGNSSKGLPSGIGNGTGNWRLELTTNLDIQPLAYIRTADGFVTAMHDVVPVSGQQHQVPFFNPGSNTRQVSRLRIFNPGSTTAEVTITGRDDAGDDAPGGTVRLTLPARSARTLTAQALEAGGAGFNGRLGNGAGKWRLSVTSNVAIQVMSLLASPTGHISNLSTVPGE